MKKQNKKNDAIRIHLEREVLLSRVLMATALIIALVFLLMATHYKHKYENTLLGCSGITKILLESNRACADFCGLNYSQIQTVYFDWKVKQIKNNMTINGIP